MEKLASNYFPASWSLYTFVLVPLVVNSNNMKYAVFMLVIGYKLLLRYPLLPPTISSVVPEKETQDWNNYSACLPSQIATIASTTTTHPCNRYTTFRSVVRPHSSNILSIFGLMAMTSNAQHCSFVLLAEFDIDRGAQLTYQFPQPLGADEGYVHL